MFKYKAEFQMFRFYNIIKVIKPIIKKIKRKMDDIFMKLFMENMKWKHLNFIVKIVKNRKVK